MPRKPDLSIIGQKYNDLIVLRYTGERNSYNRGLYECECCLCGGKALATKANLMRGEVKNCGCRKNSPKKSLVGQKFGELDVIDTTVRSNELHYVCKCSCGNTTIVLPQSLVNGSTKSCGHLRQEQMKSLFVYGTEPSALRPDKKLRATNKSGVTGVWWDKRKNLWVAEIMFQRKKYFLGRFSNKEDAIAARKTAEKEIFGDFLEWYNNKSNRGD